MNECTPDGQSLHTLLTDLANQLGRASGFVQRRSKLTGSLFAQAFVLGCLEEPAATLNNLVQVCHELGVEITEAGFQQRIDAQAVAFLGQLLQAWVTRFRQQRPLDDTVLRHFTQVNLLDSTEITLPAALSGLFAGKQGAALKVQLSFDYLSGTLNALELTSGRQPDQRCALLTACASRGSLQLFDLGYFDQTSLAQIDDQTAYFVTRFQDQTALYQPDTGQRLELEQLLRQLPYSSAEWSVELGAKARLPVRLLAERLPEAVVEARRRKAHAKARRWGKTCSQRQLDLLAWNVSITNVPADWLTVAQVHLVYRVRWQIELLFKVCKSQAGLDQIGHWSPARLQCQLYARLLGVALFQWLISPWRFWEAELSPPKGFRCLRRQTSALGLALRLGADALTQVLATLTTAFLRFAQKSRRHKSPSTYQQLVQAAP